MNSGIVSITFEGLHYRKKQLLLLFFILVLSIAFALVMMSYSSSIVKTNAENRLDTYGSWYGAILDAQDGDEDYLCSAEWIDTIGITTTVGQISLDGYCNGEYIGAVDDSFVEVGRITTTSGRLPKNDNEIAMEADLLNYLGYDYTLGQDITLTVSVETETGLSVSVTKVYVLCGILKEYTDIWKVTGSSSDDLLNTAIITSDALQDLLKEAARVSENSGYGSVETESAFYFTIIDGYEDVVSTEVTKYLAQSRNGISVRSKKIYTNTIAYADNGESSYNTVYVALIFAVTLLAVTIVYVLQMKNDIQRVVKFRSIGATKKQVILMVFTETMAICIPAVLLGILLGAVGTWAILRFSVFAGSVSVIVSIPLNLLFASVIAWILAVLAIRMLTLQVALATPLTGQMKMSIGKLKRSVAMQKVSIVAICSLLSAVVIFSLLSILTPFQIYQDYSNYYWYHLESFVDSSYTTGESLYSVTEDIIDEISYVSGIKSVRGYSTLPLQISIDGITNSSDTYINVIDYKQWTDAIDFSGVDIEAFESGDCVIISMPESDIESPTSAVGANIVCTISCISSNGSENVDITTKVGGINIYSPKTDDTYSLNLRSSYSIICSLAFLQNILDEMPEGSYWNTSNANREGYSAGSDATYRSAIVFADKSADYLVTDSEVSEIASENSLIMTSLRESNTASSQIYLQTLIMLFVSGSCIAIVIIIILSSTIQLETQREKKRYGILQAIGMSRRQRDFELARTAIIRSIIAVVLGWGVFFLTVIIRNLNGLSEEGTTVFGVVNGYMNNLTSYYMPAWAMALMSVGLFAVVFLICYTSKLGLNKYSLMEMLREDR